MNEDRNTCQTCKYYDYPYDYKCEECETVSQYIEVDSE